MAIGPREVMRSEVEGGLSGPANPIPDESLDCGCKQFPCPKLAKFATRRLFVGLLCWIGIIQGAAQAYFYITGPTVARRFQLDPILMEWIVIVAELTPFLAGLLVAYWGDRIHRAAWLGGLVLIQSAGFLILIIPHFTHNMRVIEEQENISHMSIYSEDHSELCSSGLARLVIEADEFCYIVLVLLIGVQILTGMTNVAYYALGISYLDDNTRVGRIEALIGIAIAVKIMGLLFGYVLAWGCLKLDSENLQTIVSYQEQVGAWWLGWPILAFLLSIPGLFMSWLPRRLPSEVVEQAAASILDLAGRASPQDIETTGTRKVGDTSFWSSLLRLFRNRILGCSIVAAIFCCTAVINFVAYENIFLEARYHVPKPTGMFLGFGDPLLSRMLADLLKPIIIGLVISISGIIISKVRPRAKTLTIYNIVAYFLAAAIIFSLIYATCEKPPIPEERKGSLTLLKYCNKDCHCSKDADFRPVCDARSTFTFYSPCHAGCKTVEEVDNVKVYGGCSCVEEMTGLGNILAREGPCGSDDCQIGLVLFEIGTTIAYSLVASSIVGSLLIVLRSVYVQDKALAIGFWMTFVCVCVYIPGKLAYNMIANMTCKHWGTGTICHLHDDDHFGNYICYLTSYLLILAAACQILLCYFCRNLRLYGIPISELPRETELQPIERNQAVPLLAENAASSPNATETVASVVDEVIVIETSVLDLRERRLEEELQSQPLKYGPLGPGDRRKNGVVSNSQDLETSKSKLRNEDTDDELDSSSDEEEESKRKMLGSSPQISYKPLELDSDVESDLSSIGPRSRRRIASSVSEDLNKDYPANGSSSTNKRHFPNPDDYEDPSKRSSPFNAAANQRNGKSLDSLESTNAQGGFSRTNSFEFAKNKANKNESLRSHVGDFNEVGIPVMEPLVAASILTTSASPGPTVSQQEVKVLLPRHQKQASQERLETIRSLLVSVDETRRHHLENDILREEENENYPDVPPPIRGHPPSRDQASSGFGSSTDIGDKSEIFLPLPNHVLGKPNLATSRTHSPRSGLPKGGPLSTAL